jgi:hypothetical protein
VSGRRGTFGPVRVARRIRLRWVIVLYCAAAQAYVWHEFLTLTPGTSPTPTEIIVPALAEIVTALLLAAWVIVTNRSLAWAVASTFNAMFLLVGQFSIWYLSYGGAENWSPRLTRLDGLALTLGTLTTAGAPGIRPRTDLARELITIQLVVDILAAIVLFGLFVGRLASRLGAAEAGFTWPARRRAPGGSRGADPV